MTRVRDATELLDGQRGLVIIGGRAPIKMMNCNGWTSNFASVNGAVGLKNTIGGSWIHVSQFAANNQYYVLCIAY